MTHEPLVLGIETSCDETGIGIVRGRTLLSNTIASSMDEHARYGGVVPEVAARAQKWIDQAISRNMYLESRDIGEMTRIYSAAWRKGVKTTYYLRSRPATKIAKTTVSAAAPAKVFSPDEAIACSLENPEACEACQ